MSGESILSATGYPRRSAARTAVSILRPRRVGRAVFRRREELHARRVAREGRGPGVHRGRPARGAPATWARLQKSRCSRTLRSACIAVSVLSRNGTPTSASGRTTSGSRSPPAKEVKHSTSRSLPVVRALHMAWVNWRAGAQPPGRGTVARVLNASTSVLSSWSRTSNSRGKSVASSYIAPVPSSGFRGAREVGQDRAQPRRPRPSRAAAAPRPPGPRRRRPGRTRRRARSARSRASPDGGAGRRRRA